MTHSPGERRGPGELSQYNFETQSSLKKVLTICLLTWCVGMHTRHACGGQRRPWRCQLSPSTMWGSGLEFRLSGPAESTFTLYDFFAFTFFAHFILVSDLSLIPYNFFSTQVSFCSPWTAKRFWMCGWGRQLWRGNGKHGSWKGTVGRSCSTTPPTPSLLPHHTVLAQSLETGPSPSALALETTRRFQRAARASWVLTSCRPDAAFHLWTPIFLLCSQDLGNMGTQTQASHSKEGCWTFGPTEKQNY